MGRQLSFQHMVFLGLVVGMLNLGCGAGCSGGCEETSQKVKAEATAGQTEPAQKVVPSFDMREVGRAVEFGLFDKAEELLGERTTESDRTRYLGALIAAGKGLPEQVLVLLREATFTHSELDKRSAAMVIDALRQLGRHEEAQARIQQSLDDGADRTPGERRDLVEKNGDLLMALARFKDAAQAFDDATRWSGPARAETLKLKYARALLGQGQKSRAEEVLAPLARSARTAKVMEEALALLEKEERKPQWTFLEQVERIGALKSHKSWDAADAAIEQLLVGAKGANAKELRWQKADLLFSRRRHYKEALEALELVIADGAPHRDRALFLKARALSRIDRDEEAIVAYRDYARRTSNRAKADEARWYASRLEFYLGLHKEALANIQKQFGKGAGKEKRTSLSAGTIRDAHFIAGMSALLEKKYDMAGVHLDAASKGSSSEAAVERNKYWHGVGTLAREPAAGAGELHAVCKADPSSWYSFFAAVRLSEAGQELGPCPLLPDACSGDSCGVGIASVKATPQEPSMPLSEISGTADLFAQMGLYKEAANTLREVEKSKKLSLPDRDWVIHYNLLDAPHYAIRRAAIGLDWETRKTDPWRAEAAYPIPYTDLVAAAEEQHGLPPFLVFSIARKESLFDPLAVSYVGAMGMMQMMPATYETNRKRAKLPPLTKGRLPSPAESIAAGSYELAHLLEKFDGLLPLAIMAYNGGSAAVDRWVDRSGEFPMDVFVEKGGFAQTRNYVRRVYGILYRYRQLYGAPPPVLPRDLSAHLKNRNSQQ